ncbi:hypothetical protein QTO34_005478 [Cnephaeus nilssonii]|uniref:Uncharacterized protein n=1 Tax=Cnephaeus nilssonii TaxID=3371016 RepID=A0AA40LJE9_CNENI|nr:hypothetical protein QTO34_005478 [Eptesicus nilssonii]
MVGARVASPGLESPKVPRTFPACAYMRPNAHGNHSWPESLEPEEAEPKAPAQEAEEAPAETPEVQTEASDEESDEELEAWAPPEVLPPPSAVSGGSCGAGAGLGGTCRRD